MVDTGRLPHALLLEGPAGTGKFAMARAMVQYLHCTNRTADGEPCGRCPGCVQHQTFNHIDTIYSFPVLKSQGGALSDDFLPLWREFLTKSPMMDAGLWQSMLGNPNGQPVIYVEESQEIIRKLSMTSHSAADKVVLMWLPEKMNVQCANKLLKLIEEPLPGVKLVLVSNTPGLILPTIYSRLQRVTLKRLSDREIASELTSRYGLSEQEAASRARLAAGSLLAAEGNELSRKENEEFLGSFQSLMRLAYGKKVAELKGWSVAVAGFGREKAARFCAYCEGQIRENFIANLQMPQLNYMNGPEGEFSRRFSPFINHRNSIQLATLFNKARIDILANGNAKIILFDVAVKTILLLK